VAAIDSLANAAGLVLLEILSISLFAAILTRQQNAAGWMRAQVIWLTVGIVGIPGQRRPGAAAPRWISRQSRPRAKLQTSLLPR